MDLKKVSAKQALEWIRNYQAELEYSFQYLDGRLNTMFICLLIDNGKEVGFIDAKWIQNHDLSSHDDAEFIQEALPKGKPYFFVETLNIRSSFQRKGYGEQIVSQLKQSTSKPILVQVTADSYEFWYNQGFKGVNDDDYWMSWEQENRYQSIA